ncbi:hypothetical protein GALMADRAFT_212562 [Galerina marginata CBS 339.88]|uniref:Uncharacterized protein n=1 Tax=Galerina marginata (strain CBS 339.88) TaxID=685588 RepID=A0A067T400_GALM3|nr:hypothetical protein GALMADRAFT_212562 [Galerina marginata CBS 339.88]
MDEIQARNDAALQKIGTKPIVGLLLSAFCQRPEKIYILPTSAAQTATHIPDLDLGAWIPPLIDGEIISSCIQDQLIHVERFPVDSRIVLQETFTIVITDKTYDLGPVTDILQAMKLSRAVLSGSAVLPLFSAKEFEPADLDFYTPNSSLQPLRQLVLARGYNERIIGDYAAFPSSSVSQVYKFKRENKALHIVVSNTESALQPILQFDLTLVMNYIAWYGALADTKWWIKLRTKNISVAMK